MEKESGRAPAGAPEKPAQDRAAAGQTLPASAGVPAAFLERMSVLLGGEFPAFAAALSQEPVRGLRVNTARVGLEAGLRLFGERFGLQEVPWCPEGFYYKGASRPGRHPWHEIGLYYIQEPSAMAVVSLLQPGAGERVLDLCAAPGGKATQAAALTGPGGLVVANEIHPARAKILSRNVERLGLANTAVFQKGPEELAALFPAFFDKVIVDAPCSGEGMFRRDESAGTEWSPRAGELCARRQAGILDSAAAMLRPGGVLAYSTCTFAPAENEDSAGGFLKRHPEFSLSSAGTDLQPRTQGGRRPDFGPLSPGRPDWSAYGADFPELAGTYRIWPQRARGEGHFAALFRKSEGAGQEPVREKAACAPERACARGTAPAGRPLPQKKGAKPGRAAKDRGRGNGTPLLEETVFGFLSDILSEETCASMKEACAGRLALRPNGSVFLLPPGLPADLAKVSLRPGLELGILKKDRLEPSHALALYLRPCQAKRCRLLKSAAEAKAYFAGGTLTAGAGQRGWTLVCLDGFSAGWGKAAGGVLKNHYPRGLRFLCRAGEPAEGQMPDGGTA